MHQPGEVPILFLASDESCHLSECPRVGICTRRVGLHWQKMPVKIRNWPFRWPPAGDRPALNMVGRPRPWVWDDHGGVARSGVRQ